LKLTTTQRHELIEQHISIAQQLADRYRTCGVARDDLFQEACLGLSEAARKFDADQGDFREYAFVCARNRVINLIDSELGHRSAVKLAELPATEPDPYLERTENELWSAIEILNAEDRQLIAARYGLDGQRQQTISEIAGRTKRSAATVKRRLDEIRETLRLELVKRGWRSGGNSPPPMQAQLNFA
jgi:RNA polymerase sigma factor (sigma-70 family)